jgi:ABC-type amino acid transport substrate-binding protein
MVNDKRLPILPEGRNQMRMQIKRLTGIVLVTLPFLLAVFAPSASKAESTLDKIKRTGVFVAGVRADFAPIGSLDNAGNSIGFGPALSKSFADKLGVKVKYVLVTSPTRIPMLQNGTIDADVGLTTPTKQRNELIDFTTPYLWDSMVLMVRRGGSLKIQDYGPPKKIACTQGSSIIGYIKKALPNAEIATFQDSTSVALALLQGKVDAAATDRYAARKIVAKHPDFTISEPFALDPMAIGVHQNDSKWLNWLNFTMQEMWLKGEYQALHEKYFGAKPNWQIWSAYRLQPGIGK